MAKYEYIEYLEEDGYGIILLDRPEVMNAFHDAMVDELNTCLNDVMGNDDVHALILSGNGRAFCSGGDVNNMENNRDDKHHYGAHLWQVQNIVQQLYFGSKPTIAAINGPAVGAGCDFALACDLRIMSESAILREQFVNIGLVPGDGGGWLLPRLIGESKAKEYLLTGRDISPAEAKDLGLAMKVVPQEEVLTEAHQLVDTILAKPLQAVRNTKRLIDTNQSFEDYCRKALEYQWECTNDPEHKEAKKAFLENREPSYDRNDH